jgi:hypothetical protein
MTSPPIFCADCELDHIHRRIAGARWSLPDGASQFQYPGVGKVAWRYTALAALFLCARLFGGGAARTTHVKGCRSAYPKRSLLRRGLDPTSQSIHTNATPRPTTTPKYGNVRPGAVSMVNIHNAMQAA